MDDIPALDTLGHDSHYLVCTSIEETPAWAICKPTSRGGAVLDPGYLHDDVSVPDFAPDGYGFPFSQSSERCAAAIRRNAAGQATDRNGKPKRVYPALEGYDLHYQRMPHWGRKMLMARMGMDPNAVVLAIARADLWALWPVDGEWIDKCRAVRHLEFFLHLCIAVERARLAAMPPGSLTADLLAARAHAVADAVLVEMKEGSTRVSRQDGTHLRVRLRAQRALQGHDLLPMPESEVEAA